MRYTQHPDVLDFRICADSINRLARFRAASNGSGGTEHAVRRKRGSLLGAAARDRYPAHLWLRLSAGELRSGTAAVGLVENRPRTVVGAVVRQAALGGGPEQAVDVRCSDESATLMQHVAQLLAGLNGGGTDLDFLV